MRTKPILIVAFITVLILVIEELVILSKDKRWSEERAWQWYNENGWMVGSNFNPSTSINQLEFWQEDTYDPETCLLYTSDAADE